MGYVKRSLDTLGVRLIDFSFGNLEIASPVQPRAAVMDDDIEPPEFKNGTFDQFDRTPRREDFRRRTVDIRLTVSRFTHQFESACPLRKHRCAGGTQGTDHLVADRGREPRYQRDLAVKLQVHEWLRLP
ncbi:hypothetical protein F01_460612 [Burkholderia cenocepacia]|nr:hypothetical protein F01_460612 [Burkholderia cenocepacia]